MLQNYLRMAWRYFRKDHQFTFLNLTGLSTGMACALLIYIWVSDELRMDRFHEKGDRLYQVLENRVQAQGIWTTPSTSGPMAASLKADVPEVETAVTIRWTDDVTLSVGEKNIRAEGRYADRDFFHLFSYELLQGHAGQVLADPNGIVISDAVAGKLFGTVENAVGKKVEFQHEAWYTVSGVFREAPASSSERPDFLLSMDKLLADENMSWLKGWGSTGINTFVLLKPGTDVARFNAKIADYVKRKSNNEIIHRTPFLQRYSDRYLHGRFENGVAAGGRIEYVRLFSIIAIFILVIACINFMNLSTAKAARRTKEVGIRKAVGAGRIALVLQYLGESMLMAFMSLLFALGLVALLLPLFNNITGKELALHFDTRLVLSMLGITFFTGLVSGSYPALYLSGFNPVLVLKGKLQSSAGELWARKGLVVFQFTLSVVLIVSVIVVYRQIRFIQTKHLGYNKDNVISFFKEGKLTDPERAAAFLAEVRNIPGIISASAIGHHLRGHTSGTYRIYWPGRDPEDKTEFERVPVDYNTLETLGIQLKEGRAFSPQFSSDSNGIIFNEAAVRFMGVKDPVGKTVTLGNEPMHIIGVVKDFHFESLHEKVKPLFFFLVPGRTWKFMVRFAEGKEKEVVPQLQRLYEKFNPGFAFEHRFLDEDQQRMYVAEKRVAVLSRYFAGLAILISCLGLFGLAVFTAQRRHREIGIRKVLGATVSQVVLMLSKDFLQLVAVAVLFAFPLSWWAMQRWLHNFEYRTAITADIFIIAGAAILAITLFTISFQSVKAALANPAKSLKTD